MYRFQMLYIHLILYIAACIFSLSERENLVGDNDQNQDEDDTEDDENAALNN